MYDYHTHTIYSDDGHAAINEMAKAAIKKGLYQIAITDHFDPDYCDPSWSSDLDFISYCSDLSEAEKLYHDKIKVIKGIEIGLQHGDTLNKCRDAVSANNFDFVIGSFHCAEGFELSCGGFFDNRTVENAAEAFYKYVYDCLLNYDDFDVLGHLNVIDRYSPYIPSPACYMESVHEILKLLIDKGKGIEINTSSFRYGMHDHTLPTTEILKLYRALGGEIITAGSDAHSPEHVGFRLDWAYEKMKSVGFKYVTSFSRRKPFFNKL